ncbi:MAG TPA: DUF1906 domain-containing protein [Gaiellaceae bacterium]|nr:DUF1906 domain-containing protein [Gaiellaceae bacterium]
MLGVDYASGTRDAAKLVADGAHFVCRYFSTPGNPKNLTATEAQALHHAGLHIVTVFENRADDALGGHAAGVRDAQLALGQARACGLPDDRPIFFAVDFDCTPAAQVYVNAYFVGVASVLGHRRTGAYGGYWVIKRLFDNHLISYGWQTAAWSGGQWDPRACLRQYDFDKTFGGLQVDLNESIGTDFGQWPLPVAPAPKPSDPAPHPEPKNQSPFTRPVAAAHRAVRKVWPQPVPAWFWRWAEWRRRGRPAPRPSTVPRVIPPWAWVRLAAMS